MWEHSFRLNRDFHFLGDWIKSGAIVIDCGINVLPGQGPNGKNKIVGDVAFEEAKAVASHITPVPGGVGPMTVAMLMRNTFDQAVRRRHSRVESASAHWTLRPLPLHPTVPVGADVDISRSQKPKYVGDLAAEIGLLPSELDLFGSTKAKVSHGLCWGRVGDENRSCNSRSH